MVDTIAPDEKATASLGRRRREVIIGVVLNDHLPHFIVLFDGSCSGAARVDAHEEVMRTAHVARHFKALGKEPTPKCTAPGHHNSLVNS